MEQILDVKNLTVRFLMEKRIIHAVNGISYTLTKGETLGIVGESGCGKSVSLLSLLQLVPHPGKVSCEYIQFEDRDIARINDNDMRKLRGHKISIIFQNPLTALNPVLSIGRQIQEGLELNLSMTTRQSRERAIELIRMVGIPSPEEQLSRYPHQFSGGMLQRVMIAIGISCAPRILLADEPTTALDVTVQAQIIDIVKKMRTEVGMSIIWVTHDLGVVAGLVERVIVMYAGYIVEEAPVKKLFANPLHPYTIGLLSSLPRMDQEQKKLTSIDGLPPGLAELPEGCPFYERCRFRIDKCQTSMPELEAIDSEHRVACWVKPDMYNFSGQNK
jgi:oligopeptide transport system ATP-binding protein